MEMMVEFVRDFWTSTFGPASRLWPVCLLVTLLIGFGIYKVRHVEGSFVKWLLPRSVWTHASHIVDVKLFLFTRILSVLGVFKVLAVGGIVAAAVQSLFPDGGLGYATLHPLFAALLVLMVGDFATYWVHRIHHENRILWPFHSVHHSAEVMTPITVYRKHPMYDVTRVLVHGLLMGGLQGILMGLFPQGVSMSLLLGVNAGYFLFNMLGSNFRHSHIWVSFGPMLEHVFISPAQHQIHHSVAPRHHNKNYGEVLAIWDWMFGSLYIPQEEELLEFGLGDAQGNRTRQKHDSLTAALVVPMKDSWRQVRKLVSRPATKAKDRITPAE